MQVVPLTLAQANEYVATHHRHHKPVQGHRFSIGVEKDGEIVGVCVVGRPVARKTDQYRIVEVTRCATDGTKNAPSMLYGAAARAADAMGFDSIQTFTLPSESGISLRAAGWVCEGETNVGSWHSRKGRRDDQPTEAKLRWRKILSNGRRNMRAVK